MSDGAYGGFKRILRQVGPFRLLVTVILIACAVTVGRYSWDMPLGADAERGLYDIRATRSTPRVAQDERITLVTFTDETLRELGRRSPLDRVTIARALRALDQFQPRAIGIDILFDQAQPEDEELITTLREMRTPTFLAFTTAQANPEQMQYWQEEFLRSLLQQVSGGATGAASIRLEIDREDGVMRRWPNRRPDHPPLLANAMAPEGRAFAAYNGAIAYRMVESADSTFPEIPIETIAQLGDPDLPEEVRAPLAEAFRSAIAGRYVIIGGDITNLDDFVTPMTRQTDLTTKGIEIHAQMLAQLLDGTMPPPIPDWVLWAAAILIVLVGGATSVIDVRSWALPAVLLVQLAAIALLPFVLQDQGFDTFLLPAAGWGAAWLLAFLGVGIAARAVGSEQRIFAQSALGKYLPADVANEIMRDPDRLALSGEKKDIYALFTDLEGFTKLSHAIPPEKLSELLNRYLDILSDVVLEHGGTIDKFVGDAVVAFWGAPLARPDDADRAAKAAVAMYEAGEAFRRAVDPSLPPVGVTRVGLHRGEAVVGNFGGKRRIQYTALGDGMNTAARLESANKALFTTALVSSEAVQGTTLDIFRPMGRIVVSGRATPVEVWEPVPKVDPDLRRTLRSLWEQYESGDKGALTSVETAAAKHPEDAALQNFVYRIREAGPGGSFVLGSK